MKLTLKVLAVFGILMACSATAGAQCRTYAKKKCIPSLSPYRHNGKMNTTTMLQGQTAELQMTFFQGQEYRIMVCSQPALGNVQFKLVDGSKNVLFNSKDVDSNTWDFKVKTTTTLMLEVTVPPNDSPNELVQSGCVSILIGFKE